LNFPVNVIKRAYFKECQDNWNELFPIEEYDSWKYAKERYQGYHVKLVRWGNDQANDRLECHFHACLPIIFNYIWGEIIQIMILKKPG